MCCALGLKCIWKFEILTVKSKTFKIENFGFTIIRTIFVVIYTMTNEHIYWTFMYCKIYIVILNI